jgi:hypothetical protein
VSTRSQNDDSQVDDLTAHGCEKIFTDRSSGKLAARPELDKALAYLREGDVFVITRLSRAMRSARETATRALDSRNRLAARVVDTVDQAGARAGLAQIANDPQVRKWARREDEDNVSLYRSSSY